MLPDGYRVTLEHQGSHWWFRARRQLFLRQVRRAADSLVEQQQKRRQSAHGGRGWQPGRLAVLDYGCAAGFDLGCLARMGLGTVEGADIVGVDDMLHLPDTPGARAVADGGAPIHIVPRDLPALRGRFDIVTCLDVLEHLEDDVAGLRTLATLLSGGTTLVTALQTASDSLTSKLLRSTILQATQMVREGESLHSALASRRVMPDMALDMIEVGETSGALGPMLTSIAEFYEEEVGLRLGAMVSVIEPVILIFMGILVAFILISLYLPIFSFSVMGK